MPLAHQFLTLLRWVRTTTPSLSYPSDNLSRWASLRLSMVILPLWGLDCPSVFWNPLALNPITWSLAVPCSLLLFLPPGHLTRPVLPDPWLGVDFIIAETHMTAQLIVWEPCDRAGTESVCGLYSLRYWWSIIILILNEQLSTITGCGWQLCTSVQVWSFHYFTLPFVEFLYPSLNWNTISVISHCMQCQDITLRTQWL